MKTRWFIIFIFMALVSIAGLFIPESDTLYNVVDKNINYADTSWMITSSVLVLLMTPGVSFFYGGMVSLGYFRKCVALSDGHPFRSCAPFFP